MNIEEIAKEILTTTGVNSKIKVASDGVQNNKTVGHILLVDYDSYPLTKILSECQYLPGFTALLESSYKHYHLWNLSCRTLEDTAIQALFLHGDSKHTAHGLKAGKWVLRIKAKVRRNNFVTDRPKFKQIWYNTTDLKQSMPHYRLLAALSGGKSIVKRHENVEWIGRAAEIETYLTVTNSIKLIAYTEGENKDTDIDIRLN